MQNRQWTKRLTFSKNSSKLAKKIMKEGDSTEKLVESLVEELNCETVFTRYLEESLLTKVLL